MVTRDSFFFFKEQKEEDSLIIQVYDHRKNEVRPIELNEYLKGVIAAEMPANFHMEALKAQAVAARTYTLRQLSDYGGKGSSQHPDADISTDYNYNQAWITREEMREKWGFLPFFYLWLRVSNSVEETKNEIILYNNEPIDALYHSNSGGKTENAGDVWGEKTPYMVSVESPYDKEREKNYRHSFSFEVNEFDKKLGTSLDEKINKDEESMSSNSDQLFEIEKHTEGGSVDQIKIGEKTFTGKEIRELLSLPSSKFEFSLENNEIICKVRGYGHGAGMSQDGANGFARHGYDYEQILKHYYQGVEIVDLKRLE